MIPMLAAAALLAAQDTKETYGKTNEQILAMGYTAWSAFYQKKAGISTVAMTSSGALYADALAARNARLIKRLKAAQAAKMRRLGAAMTDFKNEAVGIGVSLTGGGTMWNPIATDMQVSVETAIYRVLAGLTSQAPKRVTSDVTGLLAQLKGKVAKIDLGDNWTNVGKESLAGAEKAFAKITAELKTMPRRDSDTILEFCRKTLDGIGETGE